MQPLLRIADQWLWPDAEPTGRGRRALLTLGRYLFALFRELASGELSLRAMSLFYTTMLSLVPALGFAFTIAKGLDMHQRVEPLLQRALDPIGEGATTITQRVMSFVEDVNAPLIGALSVGILLLTVISMAQKIESSFNFVWRVDRPRSFGRRFSEYLSAILVGPVVMAIAITLITSLSSEALIARLRALDPDGAWITHFDAWLGYLSSLVPLSMTVAAFACLYLLIPNTRVRLKPAAIGGLAGGVVWTVSGFLFANLVAASSKWEVYSGFAIVLILMLWLYLSWLILLLGSQLAYYIQNPYRLRFGQRTEPIDNDARERLSLAVMYLIARDFAAPAHGWTDESLAAELRVPRAALEPIMACLRAAGLVVASDQRLLPGREPHRILLTEIIASVRGDGRNWNLKRESWADKVDAIADRVEDAIETELGSRSLGQLVDEGIAAESA
jgi:membrane protein